MAAMLEKIKGKASKSTEELMAFSNPTSKMIGEILFEGGELMLPSEIKPHLDRRLKSDGKKPISERAIYKRLRNMNDKGMVEHIRGEGYGIVLGKRYFPLVPLFVGIVSLGLGIYFLNLIAFVVSILFILSLVFYWNFEF